jgi:hypothetical protein
LVKTGSFISECSWIFIVTSFLEDGQADEDVCMNLKDFIIGTLSTEKFIR